MKSCDIKLYALSTCIHCRNTKEFLDKCGVDYDCVDVDTLEGEERRKIIEEIKRENPQCSFPDAHYRKQGDNRFQVRRDQGGFEPGMTVEELYEFLKKAQSQKGIFSTPTRPRSFSSWKDCS